MQPQHRNPRRRCNSRGRESLEQVRARRGTIAFSHQIIDLALNGPHGSARKADEQETLWSLIEEILDAGDATPPQSPDGSMTPDGAPLQRS